MKVTSGCQALTYTNEKSSKLLNKIRLTAKIGDVIII